MVNYLAVIVAACLVGMVSANAQQTRLYNARGNSVGTAVPQGEGTVRYYDARGRSVGTSTQTGNTIKFYDAAGRPTGTAVAPRGR